MRSENAEQGIGGQMMANETEYMCIIDSRVKFIIIIIIIIIKRENSSRVSYRIHIFFNR